MGEYKMDLKNSWPTINGETQSTIPFAEDHWCQPLVTLHHISSPEAEQLGSFESKRKDKSKPVTYEELFNKLVSDLIPDELVDWATSPQTQRFPTSPQPKHVSTHVKPTLNVCSRVMTVQNVPSERVIALGKKHAQKDGLRWTSSWNK